MHLDDLWRDDRHWRWNLLYVCPDDPRPIVRNRWLFGWTWNFGHPRVFRTMGLIVLVAVGPALTVLALGGSRSLVLAAAGASIVAVFVTVHRIASRS